MTNKVSKYRQTNNLLARILEEPNLIDTVQSLDCRTLGKVIRHIGLEDCGELVALATTNQLKKIFDEDLWLLKRPGEDESFDAIAVTTANEVISLIQEGFDYEKTNAGWGHAIK